MKIRTYQWRERWAYALTEDDGSIIWCSQYRYHTAESAELAGVSDIASLEAREEDWT